MYLFAKILIILLVLLFIPIPISIKVIYSHELQIYIYGIKLDTAKLKSIFKKKKDKKIDCVDKKDEDEKPQFNILKDLFLAIRDIRYKPKLKLSLEGSFGLDDAAATGIMYGIISGLLSTIYEILKIPFNIKKYDISFKPEYNKLMFLCNLKCIIFINLTKIIYICVIVLKTLKKSKKLHYSFNQTYI